MVGDLAVVEQWLAAVNDADVARLEALSSDQVEIVGPRGQGVMSRRVLGEWLSRSGFRSEQLRWFCGGDGRVVVEHVGEWHEADTGQVQGRRIIGSEFVVRTGRVARYVRHDSGLCAALEAADLDERTHAVMRRR